MQLEINGKTYDVPESYQTKLFDDMLAEGLTEYEKLSPEWRVLAKPISRGILLAIEKQLATKIGKEKAKEVRPGNEDANKHLLKLLAKVLFEGMKRASIHVNCEEGTDQISSFSISISRQGEAGRQVDTDRNIRLRENNSTQIS